MLKLTSSLQDNEQEIGTLIKLLKHRSWNSNIIDLQSCDWLADILNNLLILYPGNPDVYIAKIFELFAIRSVVLII